VETGNSFTLPPGLTQFSFRKSLNGEYGERNSSFGLEFRVLWKRYHFYGSDSIPRNYTSGKFPLSRIFLRMQGVQGFELRRHFLQKR
jgi:hypothetical protein